MPVTDSRPISGLAGKPVNGTVRCSWPNSVPKGSPVSPLSTLRHYLLVWRSQPSGPCRHRCRTVAPHQTRWIVLRPLEEQDGRGAELPAVSSAPRQRRLLRRKRLSTPCGGWCASAASGSGSWVRSLKAGRDTLVGHLNCGQRCLQRRRPSLLSTQRGMPSLGSWHAGTVSYCSASTRWRGTPDAQRYAPAAGRAGRRARATFRVTQLMGRWLSLEFFNGALSHWQPMVV
jgi:hypothetical protein